MAGRINSIVIDANLAMALAVPLPYSARAEALVDGWRRERALLHAPVLWEYELASAVRKAVALSVLLEGQAPVALERMLKMDVRRVLPDAGLHLDALQWAHRLGQLVAYDSQYLALAERLGAEFWTADRRLAQRARAIGATWVHDLGQE